MKIEEIFGKEINSIKELNAEIKRLQDEMLKLEEGTEEWKSTTEKLVSAEEIKTKILKAGKQQIDANATSIVGLEQEYKKLYNEYKLLSDQERNAPYGQEMAKRLKDVSNELNTLKKDVGNFKDNIGRYSESAVEAFGAMGVSVGGIVGPITTAKNAMGVFNKTLLANPIFWVIGALKILMEIFGKVKDAIAGNEETQMKLNEAMSAFQPILDSIANGFDWVGQKVVDFISVLAKAKNQVQLFFAQVSDFLGITEGQAEKVQQQQEKYGDFAKRTNELTLLRRENEKLNAVDRQTVETLLLEAEETDNVIEKTEKLNKAKQIQQQINERNIKEKQETLDLLQIEGSFTANDAEMNNKLAKAEADVNLARAEGDRILKRITTKINSATNAKNKETEADKESKKAKEEEIKTLNTLIGRLDDYSKTEIEKLDEKYKEEKELLEKYGKDTIKLTEEYNKKRTQLIKDQAKQEKEELEKARLERIKTVTDKQDSKFTEIELGFYANGINDDNSLARLTTEEEMSLLELRQDFIKEQLLLEELTNEERLNLLKEYYANANELRQFDIDAERQAQEVRDTLFDKKMQMGDSLLYIADATQNLTNMISQNIERELESGEITKEVAEKKKKQLKALQAVQLAVSIATIASETAMGITSLWTAFAKKKVANTQLINPIVIATANAVDLATTIAQTVGMATMATAQIGGAVGGYIANVKGLGNDSESSTPSASIPSSSIDSTSYSYTRELQTDEEREQQKAPIIVYVDDIKTALDKREIVTVETSF